MSKVILITSGKGGVGKSSLCCLLGYALSTLGERVCLVELDHGLRGLDVMLGVTNRAVYDLSDILAGRCSLDQGLVTSLWSSSLSLICAPNSRAFSFVSGEMKRLIACLRERFDTVILDCPAGLGEILPQMAQFSDLGLVVVTPDLICARAARSAADLLAGAGIRQMRLVINRLDEKRFKKSSSFQDLDEVIDFVAVQLIGVIPEDIELGRCMENALPPKFQDGARVAIENIAKRCQGQYIPLWMA